MPNFTFTDFSKRKGSPFTNKEMEGIAEKSDESAKFEEHFEVASNIDNKKLIQSELMEKANKKSAVIASNKPSSHDGVFTEVTTSGAFTAPKTITKNDETRKSPHKSPSTYTPANISKSLLGFPSSANTLALEAKSDLESDPNISQEVKTKVITKLFTLASMVQHVYESKARVLSDFDKFKEKHLRDELRREREQSEQLYKINLSFQNDIVQMIQQLKSELYASKGVMKEASSDNFRLESNNFQNKELLNDLEIAENQTDASKPTTELIEENLDPDSADQDK